MPQGVSLVGAGPGDPDLLTVKALRCIQQAEWVVYDRLVSDDILSLIPADTPRDYVGKTPYGPFTPQSTICERLIVLAQRGYRVCRLKGGDPFVFGRGGEEQLELVQAGLPVEVVPGISAGFASGAAAGIPLTHRRVSQGVTLLAGNSAESLEHQWTALAALNHTLVFYMGVKQSQLIQQNLIAGGMSGATPVAVIERASLPTQRALKGALSGLGALVETHGVTTPALIIIGEVVDLAQIEFEALLSEINYGDVA